MAINRDKVTASASKLLQAGKFDKAIQELQRLVEDDPTDVRTLLKLGDTLVKIGRRTEAIAAYQSVADVYSEQGFYLKAVAVFKQMLRVDANLPEIHLQLAEMYQQLGLQSDCLQHYQQVVMAYEQQGRGAETLDVLKKMVDLDPDNVPSRIKLGELFAQQGMISRAVEEFRSAADYLRSQDRTDDFVRVGERLIYFDPAALDITRELAKVYLKRGDAKIALGKLQVCFKAEPRNVETLSLIGEAFEKMGQVPKTVSVLKEIARIYEGQNQAEDARRAWQRVLDLAPGDGEAQKALGVSGGSPRPAAPAARAAPAPSPQQAGDSQIARLLTETDVYVKYGLRDKAVEHLKKIFELAPDHLDARERLKRIYDESGDKRAAAEQLRVLVDAGTRQNDPRTSGWARELDAIEGSFGPPAVPPPIPAPAYEEAAVFDDDAEYEEEAIYEEEAVFEEEVAFVEGDSADVQYEGADDLFIPEEEEFNPSTFESDDSALTSPTAADPSAGEIDAFANAATAAEEASDLFGAGYQAFVGGEGTDDIPPLVVGEEMADIPPFPERSVTGNLVLDDQLLSVRDAAPEDEDLPSITGAALDTGAGLDDELAAAARQGLESLGGVDDVARAFFESAFDSGASTAAPDFAEPTLASGDSKSDIPTEAPPRRNLPPPPPPEAFNLDNDADFGEATVAMPPGQRMALGIFAGLPDLGTRSGIDDGAGFVEDTDMVSGHETTVMPERTTDSIAPELLPSADVMALNSSMMSTDVAIPATSAESLRNVLEEKTSRGFGAESELEQTEIPGDLVGDLRAEFEAGLADALDGLPPPPPPESEVELEQSTQQKLGLEGADYGFEDDPASSFYPDELAEAEFFIQQDLLDEAREILEEIADDLPDSVRVKHMLSRIAAKEAGEPEPPAPWAESIIEGVEEELGELEDLGAPAPLDDLQVSVDEVLGQFKKGVAASIDENDADTHYNLGIAYREMGLLDDAIGEFRIASRAPSRAADCNHLIGLTLFDLSRHADALAAFEAALTTASANERGPNEYYRGRCLEELGRKDDAYHAYVAAQQIGAAMPDLAARVNALAAHGGGKKNIDYV